MAGILVIILQTFYTVYFIVLLRFTKLRYFLFKAFSHVLLIGTFTVTYIGSVSDIGNTEWENSSIVYIICLMGHVLFYFLITVMEILFNRQKVVKYLKSFYLRFIKCEKIDDKIEMTRYDEDNHREKVTEFHANLLYQQSVGSSKRSIEMEMMSRP